jgi:broad specificity phosphatase PhoE
VPGRLWTSTMVRTRQTATYIDQPTILIEDKVNPHLKYEWKQMRPRMWHNLDELFAGQFDGFTYEEIEEQFPDEFRRRKVDKLAYRYPRGESYLDVIARLEPIILEMERHKEPVLIIGHQGILRVVYAFYMGKTRAETPYVSIPLNTVVQLTPGAFTCQEEVGGLNHRLFAVL